MDYHARHGIMREGTQTNRGLTGTTSSKVASSLSDHDSLFCKCLYMLNTLEPLL
jgi:hypothetical protein